MAADIDGLLPHVADGQKGLCVPKSFSVQLGAQLTASPTLTCVLRDSTHRTDSTFKQNGFNLNTTGENGFCNLFSIKRKIVCVPLVSG